MYATEKCPWCGNAISHEKFIQIETQIREQEKSKLAELEQTMRERLDAEFSHKVESARAEAVKLAQEEADKRLAVVSTEKELLQKKFQEAEVREAEARKRAQEETERVKTLQHTFEQRLTAEKQAAEKRGKSEAEQEAAKRLAAVSTEKELLQKKFREAEVREVEARKRAQEETERVKTLQHTFEQRLTAEKQVAEKRARDETEAVLKKEMEHQRIILQQEHNADLSKQRFESHTQAEALLKKVHELEHKLEQKTADQKGDWGEGELYEALRQQFPGDKISRVPKGQTGPDILHQVLYKGETCGQIVYDSKNQQRWLSQWTTKLHQDQIDAGAEHAILATTVFPAGKKELCIDESGVILVSPEIVVHIAHLLRAAMIEMHKKGLGQKERAGKTNRLYEFITSNEYKQQFDQVQKLTEELLDLDVEEKKAHDRVWKERGQRLRKQQNALSEIDTKVAAIVEAPSAEHSSAA